MNKDPRYGFLSAFRFLMLRNKCFSFQKDCLESFFFGILSFSSHNTIKWREKKLFGLSNKACDMLLNSVNITRFRIREQFACVTLSLHSHRINCVHCRRHMCNNTLSVSHQSIKFFNGMEIVQCQRQSL